MLDKLLKKSLLQSPNGKIIHSVVLGKDSKNNEVLDLGLKSTKIVGKKSGMYHSSFPNRSVVKLRQYTPEDILINDTSREFRKESQWNVLSSSTKVKGRILNPVKGGYSVGIGGLVGFLPNKSYREEDRLLSLVTLNILKSNAYTKNIVVSRYIDYQTTKNEKSKKEVYGKRNN